MISDMSIQIDGVEYLTTAEVVELAQEMGVEEVSAESVANAARLSKIDGARKLWDGRNAPWVMPASSVKEWFETRRPRGRPRLDDEDVS